MRTNIPATTWFVYMIETTDHALYTGITTDLDRRFEQHREGTGAKFFRIHEPKKVVYSEAVTTRADALRRERKLKAMTAPEKRALFQSTKN